MLEEKSKIVLCAEDDPDDKDLFCETAHQVDPIVQVIHADNGVILLEKLELLTVQNKLPCLIILDMNMPIMGGRETVERIKGNKLWGNIPICLYSTSPRHLYLDLELKYGVVVVKKPDNMFAIIESVKFLLSHCEEQ